MRATALVPTAQAPSAVSPQAPLVELAALAVVATVFQAAVSAAKLISALPLLHHHPWTWTILV